MRPFTGYFDSDGKDIFDQDIIEFFEQGNPYEGEHDSKGNFLVTWNTESLQWDAVFYGGDTLPLGMLDPGNLTIISNIHENPELLEVAS